MESDNSNKVQDLKNKLNVHTFVENVGELLKKEKKYTKVYNFLTDLLKKGKLYDLNFTNDYDYIKKQYLDAKTNFQYNKRVSLLSYGIANISSEVYLYMTTDKDEILKFVKNYDYIEPFEYKYYINKSNATESSVYSDMILKAGLNISGYSFEFNLNYFMKILSDLIELPNLVIEINSHYSKPNYKELDVAYYNKNCSKNDNNNISLLRTNCHFNINNKKIVKETDKDFIIFNNSLILGEIKSKFPKLIYPKNVNEKCDKNKDNKNFKNKCNNKDNLKKEKPSLESIINSMFDKLDLYFKLYKNIKWFNSNEIKIIQLIFFYDNIQIKNIDENEIIKIINKKINSLKLGDLNNIPIHFYIVYALPSITNVNIFELQKEIKLLKENLEKKNIEITDLNNKYNEILEILKNMNISNNKDNNKIELKKNEQCNTDFDNSLNKKIDNNGTYIKDEVDN